MRGRWAPPVRVEPGRPVSLGGVDVVFEDPHLGGLPYVFVDTVAPTGRQARHLLEPGYAVTLGAIRLRVVAMEDAGVVVTWCQTNLSHTGGLRAARRLRSAAATFVMLS